MTGYYGIITADVLHDKLLKPVEKMIYCEITANIGTGKYCIVDLADWCEIYDCKETTLKTYLENLEKRNYIEATNTPTGKQKIVVK